MIKSKWLLIACLIFISNVLCDLSVNGPDLFDKDNSMDKLVLSNQIGYHFKKVVREVTQELFVSRRIDVSALFLGMNVLKQANLGLTKYCKSLTPAVASPIIKAPESKYKYVFSPSYASFPEAKARCKAIGRQLPELYDDTDIAEFTLFLRDKNIDRVFAGIQPDLIDGLHRFISTGFPLWQTPHRMILNNKGEEVNKTFVLDDINAEFLYTRYNTLVAVWEWPSPAWHTHSRVGDPRYRERVKTVSQHVMPIVCELPWDGTALAAYAGDSAPKEFNLEVRLARSVDSNRTSRSNSDRDSDRPNSLVEYCLSIASQAGEIEEDMNTKLKALLSLVDISIQLESSRMNPRNRRSPFLAGHIFFTGVRMIWNLYGFLQRMRMNARIGSLENSLSITQAQVNNNTKTIKDMSLKIYSQSIAIDQLTVTTADLSRRLTEVEKRVSYMEYVVQSLASKLNSMTSLAMIASLIVRIQQSLNAGYDILKDIIHCSLLGQTSPLLLPVDQIRLVQNEVQKVSTGILDTEFARMQSVVVADPQDPHLLLVVINVAALDRRNVELIKLVPVPYFEGSKAYSPILDYDTVILDQLSGKYSVLTEQEEYDCLFNRCYISDIAHDVTEKTCGMPQWFNHHLDACVSQEIQTDGVYLKPMLPDGVLFAFKGEVTTQLFCKDNNVIGPLRKMNGTGSMQLPNGCILSVSDKQGRNTKVKGQPLYRMINADDLTLAINGPLSALQAINARNYTHKMEVYGSTINEHLTSMVRQVQTVDHQLKGHKIFIWILVALVLMLVALALLFATFAYQHRSKFYFKIHELRDRFMDIHQTISDVRRQRMPTYVPHAPPRPNLAPETEKNKINHYGTLPEYHKCNEEVSASYIFMNDAPPLSEHGLVRSQTDQPTMKPFVKESNKAGFYPSLTPLFDQLSTANLRLESDEVDKLCRARFESLPKNN